MKQRCFDTKPLMEALCWEYRTILWTTAFLVEPPNGMSHEQATALAYLELLIPVGEYVMNNTTGTTTVFSAVH